MNRKLHIKINKLYNSRDIDLNLNEKMNIIVGENGCGKSTVLKMINWIINNDYISLAKIPFQSLELTIGNKTITIHHDDLIRMPASYNPEYRFIVKECLENSDTFEKFYTQFEKKNKLLKSYDFKVNESYDLEDVSYLDDDNIIYQIRNYNDEFLKSKIVFGSKLYLMQVFNVFKNKDRKLFTCTEFDKAQYYSFVDLKSDYYDVTELNIFRKYLLLRKLRKKMRNKLIKIKNNKLVFSSKKSKKIIDASKLSSGEKKICQLYKSVISVNRKTLVLLDEPELSLSFRWNKELIKILKSAARKTKLIIASQQLEIEDEKDLESFVPIIDNYE